MRAPSANILVKTLHMQAPVFLPEISCDRKTENTEDASLAVHETFLRKQAYRNTSIATGDSFFNDADMRSEYKLVVVYDEKTNTPLLSCRYYSDAAIIERALRGDTDSDHALSYNRRPFQLDQFKEGHVILADRLSGNVRNSIYRGHRHRIFALFYQEIVRPNKESALMIMVRQEKREQQLQRYLRMGFHHLGSVLHKGKAHNVLLSDLKKA